MNEQFENMMCRIKQLEFVLVELNLYLDSHPSDAEALAYYKQIRDEHAVLAAKCAECGMPLTAGASVGQKWDWVMSPWPWESVCN